MRSFTIALSLFFCVSLAFPQGKGHKVEYRTLLQDGVSFHSDQPIVFIIQNKHEEEGFVSMGKAKQSLPAVDYAKESVICMVGGKRDIPGTKLSIDSLAQTGNSLRIYSHESASTGNEFAGNVPCHIVAIKKAKVSVEFDQEWFKKHSKK